MEAGCGRSAPGQEDRSAGRTDQPGKAPEGKVFLEEERESYGTAREISD